MSRKFELIEEYPGSPAAGLEVFQNGQWYQSDFATGKNIPHFFQPANIVENNPKFWKEIIANKYEILSFIDKTGDSFDGKLLVKKANGLFQWAHLNYEGNCTAEELVDIMSKSYSINSVKRLSDGVIFTLGDMIDGYFYENRKLLGFKIDSRKGLMLKQECGHTELEDAKHTKKPTIEVREKYTYKNKEYFVAGVCSMKNPCTREWYDCIIYYSAKTGNRYVREAQEFFERFTKINA